MLRNIIPELNTWVNKSQRKPLLLQGARQVGKTYILKNFGEKSFRHNYSINFENENKFHKIFEKDLDPVRILKEISFAFNADIDLEHDFLIFDEIQACPPALTSLKYFNEKLPQFALAAAGSLLGVHLGETSFPVGKVDMLKLNPLNFIEFLHALQQQQLIDLLNQHNWMEALPEMAHLRLLELWKYYLIIGGMPEIIQTFLNYQQQPVKAFHEVRIKQNELIHAYNSDIAKHAGKVNAMHIARVWEQAAIQLSKTQNNLAARFLFKDVVPGIDRYQRLANAIDWLDAANLIIKIPIANRAELPLKAYSKESLFKLIYFDTGLLGIRSELNPTVILQNNYGSYKGYMAENFVAQELKSMDFHDMNVYFSWQEQKAEIEFLQNSEFGIIPLEVKAGTNIKAKSLEKFIEKYHPNRSVVLSAQNILFDKEKRIYYCPLYLAGLQPWLKLDLLN